DEHVTSLGIEQKLPPVALTAPDFTEKVEAMPGGARAKASEMEHAIRHHITVNKAKDPAYYQQFSERLEEILQELREDWDQQVLALEGLITELKDDAPTTRTASARWRARCSASSARNATTPTAS